MDQLRQYRDLKSYLNEERISLFHEIVDLAIGHGVKPDDKIIGDVGCGMGYLFRRIGQLSVPEKMIGYDTFSEILELGRLMSPEAAFINKSIYEIERQHDITFCMEVLEHMVDPEEGLRLLYQQTRPCGVLILSVPNGRYDFQESGNMRADGKSYWGHIHFWSSQSWQLFLSKHLPEGTEIKTGPVGTKHLFAIIEKDNQGH